ncbi:4'-phosphopantetheinyl transferase superfamily protein [Flavobacterium sp.]|uniref:4'-phosphopantetheinyl transferase family protein n=1 Tax=Flavobacterium sp. TaxID=239 RepID=UPI00286DB141|nr:4'-phosphopantetheinyl transferase superfamily protein [Flavobacterium sp.]
MIGNDIIDLKLARKESNWQRKGFLNKIFTENEQILIQNSNNQEVTVWNLWSRKEAAYKIWNRETGIRKYNPIRFECFDFDSEIGEVKFDKIIFYTKTLITKNFIHTIAVANTDYFDTIKTLENSIGVKKKNELPYIFNFKEKIISKSHHGHYQKIIMLD